jgi:hypothetical protein
MDIILFCMLTASCQLKQTSVEANIEKETIELAAETDTITDSSKDILTNE